MKIIDDNYNFEDLMMIDYQDQIFHVISFDPDQDITTFIKIDSNIDIVVKVSMSEMKDSAWLMLRKNDWTNIDLNSIKDLIKYI